MKRRAFGVKGWGKPQSETNTPRSARDAEPVRAEGIPLETRATTGNTQGKLNHKTMLDLADENVEELAEHLTAV